MCFYTGSTYAHIHVEEEAVGPVFVFLQTTHFQWFGICMHRALVLKQCMSYGPISFDAVSVYDVYLRAGSFESSCDLHSCLLIPQLYPVGDMQKTQP